MKKLLKIAGISILAIFGTILFYKGVSFCGDHIAEIFCNLCWPFVEV